MLLLAMFFAYTLTNITNSLTYSIRVKARNGYGVEADDDYWSGWSDGIIVDNTPPTGKPSTPTDIGNYSTATTITFSWGKGTADDAETGIGGYRLQIKGVKGTVIETIFDGDIGNILSYATVNATHSLTYYARVKAKNGYEVEADDTYWSNWSDGIIVDTTPPTGKPSTPTDIGNYSTATTITFSWGKGVAADAETGISGYRLQVRGVKGTVTETIFDGIVGNVLAYTIVNATHSLTYYARVKARNGCGVDADDWSDWSNGITIDTTPPTGTPSTPTDTGNYSTATTLTFSWGKGAATDTESGIGGYRLQVQVEGVKGTVTAIIFDINVGNTFVYTLVNATNSLTYRVRVKARNGCGVEAIDDYWSGWSDGITVDTTPPAPPTINPPAEGLKIISGKVTLTGKTEEGATLYQITIRDKNGNILLQEKTSAIATIDTNGNISVIIDSGELARNYPLSSQIVIEITVQDKAGNLVTSRSSLISFPASMSERFTLYNNLFDPTKNEKVIVKYEVTENTEVSIMIYDFRGNLIKSLVDSYQNTGIYTKTWDGRNNDGVTVASGIYLIQIKAGGFKEMKKIAVVE